MPNSFDDVNAKCPFFGSSGIDRVICEGMNDDCISILKFKGVKSRNKYRENFCDSRYERCHLYKALEEKYEKK